MSNELQVAWSSGFLINGTDWSVNGIQVLGRTLIKRGCYNHMAVYHKFLNQTSYPICAAQGSWYST